MPLTSSTGSAATCPQQNRERSDLVVSDATHQRAQERSDLVASDATHQQHRERSDLRPSRTGSAATWSRRMPLTSTLSSDATNESTCGASNGPGSALPDFWHYAEIN